MTRKADINTPRRVLRHPMLGFILITVLGTLPGCPCGRAGPESGPNPAQSGPTTTEPGPKTLRPARILEPDATGFVAIDTVDGIQELRIASDEKVDVFVAAQQETSLLAAMLPSRPEICRVRLDRSAEGADSSVRRSVQWLDPTKPSDTPRQVDLGAEDPSAILAMGDRCLVAFTGKVEVFDFKTQPPGRKTVHSYDKPASKPIDTFAWDRQVVVGVDDWVMPKFAFVYHLETDGSLRPKYTSNLGTLTNGVYGEAVLADGWLLAMTYEGYRGGESQGLQLFSVGEAELKQRGRADESTSTDGKEKTVLAGADMTSWRAVGIAGDRILVCASARGILTLPPDLPKGAKAETLDASGRCDDMLVVDERIYVLDAGNSRKPGQLRAYTFSGGKLQRQFERDLGVMAREIVHPSSRQRQTLESE